MLEILYFAWVKDRMGLANESVPVPPGATTVADLAAWLRARDPQGAQAFIDPASIRAAVNQDFARPGTPIHDGDEVAFFPPVTGG